jgi:hypothetical protein
MSCKIEELKKKALEVDSDLAYMGIRKKIKREERMQDFMNNWHNNLSEVCDVSEVNNGFQLIFNNLKYIYFPKSDKLFKKLPGQWYENGLKILKKEILNL